MAHVVFYEKPGCRTNARQRAALEAAGHSLDVRSLLAEPWTQARLAAFFGATPVEKWFNPAAPRVKSGEIRPESFSAGEALALMLVEPLLIRRPLIEAGDARCAGFDREPVLSLLGGRDLDGLEGCSRHGAQEGAHCPPPAGA